MDAPADGTQSPSPLRITGTARVFEGQFNARIVGADGNVLVERSVFGGGPVGPEAAPFDVLVAFNVGEPTRACLEVFDVSERDGSVIDVVQREVTLLPGAERAGGTCPLNSTPPDPNDPDVELVLPEDLAEVAGGSLHIEGMARVFEANVSLRVIAPDGSEVLSASIAADAGAPEKAGFRGDLAYSVDRPISACLQVYSLSPRDGSIENLVQRELLLRP